MTTLRELIHSEVQWTQRADARDQAGNIVAADNPEAVCWSLIGGSSRISDGRYNREIIDMLRVVCSRLYATTNFGWWQDNPTTTWPMIDRLLDEAGFVSYL